MNSRERVIATLTFNQPDRVPRQLWTLPYIPLNHADDLEAVLAQYPPDLINLGLGLVDYTDETAHVGRYVDEWGSTWEIAEAGVIGEVKQPAIPDWSALAHFQPPWHMLENRDFDAINRQCAETEAFTLSEGEVRPFERLQFLRGTENLFIDLAYDTPELRQLIEMVHDYNLKVIDGWCKSDVDAVFFLDDWGTQERLLINPKTWRAVFKPLYKDYCDRIHAAGKFVFMHSDGHIAAIYPDLIEIGVNAVNSQLFCMDIEKQVAPYKGQITFWGEIDRQRVLPFGTLDEVREAVRRVRRALDDGSGGVIAQCEWGKDNTREAVETVFETWLEPLPQATES